MAKSTYTKQSGIHGRGVFARQRFERDVLIGKFVGRRTREDGEHVLWVIEDDGSVHGVEGRNALRYLNHSVQPNAEFYGMELYSTRVIRPNEEITIHYGDDWEDV